MTEPRVTFAFGTRGLDRVRKDVQSVLNLAQKNAPTAAGRGTRAGAARDAAAEKEATRAVLVEAERRRRTRARENDEAAKGEARITAVAASGARARGKVADDEAAAKAKAIAKAEKAAERAEAARTRVAERETRRRSRLEEQEARRRERREQREQRARERATETRARNWGSNAERFATGAMGYAGAMHGEIQSERRRAANVERSAGLAFYQAGARTPGEIAERVAQTRAFARANGMTTEELLSAANAAQTEFSSLQGATQEDRRARFTNMLNTMALARNTGNDPAEMARLQGMLAQTGFDEGLQRQTLLYTAGASQQGAVEAGSLTREAMGSIMRRMQDRMTALGPGATSEQRQAASAEAFREQVAELQVFRGRGNRVGISGNASASMQEALRGTNRQDKLLNNIRVAREATTDRERQRRLDQLQEQLFEADPTRGGGARRLRGDMQNPLALAATYASVMGNDATGLLNLVAGGGHGNPQSMQANWRNLLSQLVASDAEGVTGYARVQRLMSPNVALTEERVREGAAIFGNDALSQLNREDESRSAALMDSAATTFSNAVAKFQAENPFASGALGAVVPSLLGFAANLGGRALGGVLPAAPGGGTPGAPSTTGVAIPGALGGGLTGGQTMMVAAAGLIGAAIGDQINAAIMDATTGRNYDGSLQDHNTFSIFGDGLGAFVGELRSLPGEISHAFAGTHSQPNGAALAAELARADEQARLRRS